jgi:hypothetical protein
VFITRGQQEQQLIGQDQINYTLKGSTTFVNLTKALDVRVQHDEKLSNTNSTRLTLMRVNYQTDQIDGQIVVTNHKTESVLVVLHLTLVGKTSHYSLPPKKDTRKVHGDVANGHNDIRWEVTVPPKANVEIKYTRHFNRRV